MTGAYDATRQRWLHSLRGIPPPSDKSRVLGNSHQAWVGGIMLAAEKGTEKKAPNLFEQQYGDALANLATNPAAYRGNREGSSETARAGGHGEIRSLALFGASIAERASETATSA